MRHCHSWSSAVLPLSGRCFVRYRKEEPFEEVVTSSSSPLGISEAAFCGNSYYLSQLRASRYRKDFSSAGCSGRSPSLNESTSYDIKAGDILLDFQGSVHRFSQNKRSVDVSGVITSYFNASEQSLRAKATLPELINTMHWHDGSSVPELSRGNISIGSILMFAAAKDAILKSSPSSAVPNRGHRLPSVQKYPIRNGSIFFCERKSLAYYSIEEGMGYVEAIAERCRLVAPKCVLQPILCRRSPHGASGLAWERNRDHHLKFKTKRDVGIQSFLIKLANNDESQYENK